MIDIPARYARDPRIAHIGGHHIVIAGGARIYEHELGPFRYTAEAAGDEHGIGCGTLDAALEMLLGDPQLSKLAQALADAIPELAVRAGMVDQADRCVREASVWTQDAWTAVRDALAESVRED